MQTSSLTKSLLVASCIFASPQLLADWSLNPTLSSLDFITTKNNAIAEVSTFDKISGTLDDNGKATLTIDLNSVNTKIGIRDDRMRKLLFETVKFPAATISTQVNMDRLKTMQPGASVLVEASYHLTLHGIKQGAKTPLRITRLADGGFNVASTAPIIVSAASFDLQGGIKALQDIANLSAIDATVPVTLNLVFDKN